MVVKYRCNVKINPVASRDAFVGVIIHKIRNCGAIAIGSSFARHFETAKKIEKRQKKLILRESAIWIVGIVLPALHATSFGYCQSSEMG